MAPWRTNASSMRRRVSRTADDGNRGTVASQGSMRRPAAATIAPRFTPQRYNERSQSVADAAVKFFRMTGIMAEGKINARMSPVRSYRAGESLEDYCRACKTDRQHTVIAADPQGQPIRVVCGFCGSEHNYRGGPRIETVGARPVPAA